MRAEQSKLPEIDASVAAELRRINYRMSENAGKRVTMTETIAALCRTWNDSELFVSTGRTGDE